jgi:pyrroloquinoline quinone biosynthesis protein E
MPYCSNPLELEDAAAEINTAMWQSVLRQAAHLGVLQLHLSGANRLHGATSRTSSQPRPMLDFTRTSLPQASYSAVRGLRSSPRAASITCSFLIQDVEPVNADRIAHYDGALGKKRGLARWVREIGLALTINAPVHRQNLDRLESIIDLAIEMGAGRLEVAHVQYYGWALKNRAALMPTRAQIMRSFEIVHAARERLKGILVIDFVVPDYYATWPKPCMGGWARASSM